MLVITRRPNEVIVIETSEADKNIELIVLGIRGRQVRIGIKAPREIAVHRQEVQQRLQSVREQSNPEVPLFLPVEPLGE